MGSDSRMFNGTVSSLDDLSREINSVQTCVSTRLSQLEQSTASHRLLVSNDLKSFFKSISSQFQSLQSLVRATALLPRDGSSIPVERNPQLALETVQQHEPQDHQHPPERQEHSSCYDHIPTVNCWTEVVQQWVNGCREKNLSIPLKDWPIGTRSGSLKYKYHDRKLIAVEYLKLGHDRFVQLYSPDSITLKCLKRKIRDKNE